MICMRYFWHLDLWTLLVVSESCNIHAQKGIEAGAFVGVSNYLGDLNTYLDLTRPGISAGLFAKRNFNNRVSLRGGFHFSRVSGTDEDSPNNFERIPITFIFIIYSNTI